MLSASSMRVKDWFIGSYGLDVISSVGSLGDHMSQAVQETSISDEIKDYIIQINSQVWDSQVEREGLYEGHVYDVLTALTMTEIGTAHIRGLFLNSFRRINRGIHPEFSILVSASETVTYSLRQVNMEDRAIFELNEIAISSYNARGWVGEPVRVINRSFGVDQLIPTDHFLRDSITRDVPLISHAQTMQQSVHALTLKDANELAMTRLGLSKSGEGALTSPGMIMLVDEPDINSVAPYFPVSDQQVIGKVVLGTRPNRHVIIAKSLTKGRALAITTYGEDSHLIDHQISSWDQARRRQRYIFERSSHFLATSGILEKEVKAILEQESRTVHLYFIRSAFMVFLSILSAIPISMDEKLTMYRASFSKMDYISRQVFTSTYLPASFIVRVVLSLCFTVTFRGSTRVFLPYALRRSFTHHGFVNSISVIGSLNELTHLFSFSEKDTLFDVLTSSYVSQKTIMTDVWSAAVGVQSHRMSMSDIRRVLKIGYFPYVLSHTALSLEKHDSNYTKMSAFRTVYTLKGQLSNSRLMLFLQKLASNQKRLQLDRVPLLVIQQFQTGSGSGHLEYTNVVIIATLSKEYEITRIIVTNLPARPSTITNPNSYKAFLNPSDFIRLVTKTYSFWDFAEFTV